MNFAALRNVMIGAGVAMLSLCAPYSAAAQDHQGATPVPGILLIDPDRLFSASSYGHRLADELRNQAEDLASENRGIEEELRAEAQSLTERRATMSVSDFRTVADAFDERVQQIRQEQDAKERALSERLTQEREKFVRATQPILFDLMQERGAQMILDGRSVMIRSPSADITEDAIAAVNTAIGDGSELNSDGTQEPQTGQ